MGSCEVSTAAAGLTLFAVAAWRRWQGGKVAYRADSTILTVHRVYSPFCKHRQVVSRTEVWKLRRSTRLLLSDGGCVLIKLAMTPLVEREHSLWFDTPFSELYCRSIVLFVYLHPRLRRLGSAGVIFHRISPLGYDKVV